MFIFGMQVHLGQICISRSSFKVYITGERSMSVCPVCMCSAFDWKAFVYLLYFYIWHLCYW